VTQKFGAAEPDGYRDTRLCTGSKRERAWHCTQSVLSLRFAPPRSWQRTHVMFAWLPRAIGKLDSGCVGAGVGVGVGAGFGLGVGVGAGRAAVGRRAGVGFVCVASGGGVPASDGVTAAGFAGDHSLVSWQLAQVVGKPSCAGERALS
jgi:hypothetical protein